jgi:hypothetical protein
VCCEGIVAFEVVKMQLSGDVLTARSCVDVRPQAVTLLLIVTVWLDVVLLCIVF